MDLKDFAKDNIQTGGVQCATCALDDAIMAEVLAGRDVGLPYPTISAWLREEHGITIRPASLRAHFVNHREV